jgi:hypothetical protein
MVDGGVPDAGRDGEAPLGHGHQPEVAAKRIGIAKGHAGGHPASWFDVIMTPEGYTDCLTSDARPVGLRRVARQ